VLLSNLATAITSRTVGKPTWWLGPSVDPAPIAYVTLPIALVAIPLLLFYKSHPRAPRFAAGCACALAVVAVIDLGRSPGVAVVEIGVAVAALLRKCRN